MGIFVILFIIMLCMSIFMTAFAYKLEKDIQKLEKALAYEEEIANMRTKSGEEWGYNPYQE